jgi:hypothetical protein
MLYKVEDGQAWQKKQPKGVSKITKHEKDSV